jgi:hypothetical protein
VPLPEPAGIGTRHETCRQSAGTEELLEAFEPGEGFLREFDTNTAGPISKTLGLAGPCFT